MFASACRQKITWLCILSDLCTQVKPFRCKLKYSADCMSNQRYRSRRKSITSPAKLPPLHSLQIYNTVCQLMHQLEIYRVEHQSRLCGKTFSKTDSTLDLLRLVFQYVIKIGAIGKLLWKTRFLFFPCIQNQILSIYQDPETRF